MTRHAVAQCWHAVLASLALVMMAVPAGAAQAGGSAPAADPAKKGRAAICAAAYDTYAIHADFAVGSRFKTRRDQLMASFGLSRGDFDRLRPPSRLSPTAMMGMPQNWAQPQEAQELAKCDAEFGFTPVTVYLSGNGLFYVPNTFRPHCAASFVLASSVWPQQGADYLARTQLVIDQHLDAIPDLNRAETEQRVKTDAQALANRSKTGELHIDAFKADVLACAREHGVENLQTAKARAAEPMYQRGRQLLPTDKAAGRQLLGQSCDMGSVNGCLAFINTAGPQGRSVEADREIAFALGKACTLGDGQSCYNLAYSLDPGTMLGGFKRELRSSTDALRFYKEACNVHKINDACMSVMSAEGW